MTAHLPGCSDDCTGIVVTGGDEPDETDAVACECDCHPTDEDDTVPCLLCGQPVPRPEGKLAGDPYGPLCRGCA